MMEWVLRELPNVDPYIDDILIGSMGSNIEELVANHERDVRKVMETLLEHQIVCSPQKSQFFTGMWKSVDTSFGTGHELQPRVNYFHCRNGNHPER